MTFQELLMTLERFWAERGCVIQQPYDIEVGAGTFNPATLLRVLGPGREKMRNPLSPGDEHRQGQFWAFLAQGFFLS